MIENIGMGVAFCGAALGAGVSAIGAGLGISRIAASSVESMARQPEVKRDINGAMILTAALIEGVALFAVATCFLLVLLGLGKIPAAKAAAAAVSPEKAAAVSVPTPGKKAG